MFPPQRFDNVDALIFFLKAAVYIWIASNFIKELDVLGSVPVHKKHGILQHSDLF